MLRSLVGSEMCIRDRSSSAAKTSTKSDPKACDRKCASSKCFFGKARLAPFSLVVVFFFFLLLFAKHNKQRQYCLTEDSVCCKTSNLHPSRLALLMPSATNKQAKRTAQRRLAIEVFFSSARQGLLLPLFLCCFVLRFASLPSFLKQRTTPNSDRGIGAILSLIHI